MLCIRKWRTHEIICSNELSVHPVDRDFHRGADDPMHGVPSFLYKGMKCQGAGSSEGETGQKNRPSVRFPFFPILSYDKDPGSVNGKEQEKRHVAC